jgi:ADP-heptose:LPS heptosyltransferase
MKTRSAVKRSMSTRGLERIIKQGLIGKLSTLMRATSGPAPDWRAGEHRILVLRYDRIGDMVLSTGIIRAIALAQPTLKIDVLASVQNAAALEGNPHIGRIIIVNRRRLLSWIAAIIRVRCARFDAVMDVMVMAPSLTTMLIMWASGARHRIGLGDRGHECVFTLPVPRLHDAIHYVDHSAALLAAFGVHPEAVRDRYLRDAVLTVSRDGAHGWGIWRPELFLTPAELDWGRSCWGRDSKGRVDGTGVRLVVNVSAGAAWRYWPSACFVEAIALIRSIFPGMQCLVIGAPQDVKRMRQISRATGVALVYTARSRQMMSIVASSDAVFTADTSVTHIASAFGKPMLVMFARGKAALWGPYDVPGSAVCVAGQSLEELKVSTVIDALTEVITFASANTGQRPESSPDAGLPPGELQALRSA